MDKLGRRSLPRGKHWQNGFIELFNGKLRDERLNRECFLSRSEARAEVVISYTLAGVELVW